MHEVSVSGPHWRPELGFLPRCTTIVLGALGETLTQPSFPEAATFNCIETKHESPMLQLPKHAAPLNTSGLLLQRLLSCQCALCFGWGQPIHACSDFQGPGWNNPRPAGSNPHSPGAEGRHVGDPFHMWTSGEKPPGCLKK